ncbi:MAG: hydroxyacid dehydrogenase, partial [Acidobacteria bacterium]|nr:hydroxyacid dehydrogenase [Acidobacteriota bacterium]
MKILLASPIHDDALRQLKERYEVATAYDAPEDVLKERIRGCSVLVFRSGVNISADVMAQAPGLQLAVRAGSGCENIDLDYVRRHGIELVRVPGPGAKAVAELAFALMLNLARNVRPADQQLRQGRWAKHRMTGYLLTGKVLGIVGAGNIGTRVGELGAAWGMSAVGCVEHYSLERAADYALRGIHLTTFDEVLSTADFVTLHVPRTPATIRMIGRDAIGRMKPGAFLVNLARGGVVDERAVGEALGSGRLRGAALDVHEAEGEGRISPLAGLDNV